VAWIPLACAAQALVDIAVADGSQMPSVLHLAHPKPAPWTSLLEVISGELGVQLVPYADWLSALEKSVKDTSRSEVQHMRENPALRLLAFFNAAAKVDTGKDHGREAMGLPLMDMSKAKEVSPRLQKLGPLGQEDVRRWLGFWKAAGLIHYNPQH
jgi:hypothetical protein